MILDALKYITSTNYNERLVNECDPLTSSVAVDQSCVKPADKSTKQTNIPDNTRHKQSPADGR